MPMLLVRKPDIIYTYRGHFFGEPVISIFIGIKTELEERLFVPSEVPYMILYPCDIHL